jgi:hypothetical protein
MHATPPPPPVRRPVVLERLHNSSCRPNTNQPTDGIYGNTHKVALVVLLDAAIEPLQKTCAAQRRCQRHKTALAARNPHVWAQRTLTRDSHLIPALVEVLLLGLFGKIQRTGKKIKENSNLFASPA